ncbi:MAG: hypothetical protein ABSA96_00975 [Candidatus Acidiferrales bacterium]
MSLNRIARPVTRCLGGVLAILLCAWCVAGADNKKPAAPAPKPAAKPASGGASKPVSGGASASHGPSTASHGPTTSGHGPTTSTTTGHGPTTAGKGPSTTNAGHAPSTGGAPGKALGPSPAGNRTAGGRPVPAGNRVVRSPNGNEVRTRPNGRPADVHVAGRGMDIHHGLDGSRHVSVERGDHSRIVADRRGRGYVQHPYMYHGREFAHRTYYRDGRAYDRFYGRYPYHGLFIEAYSPAFYFAPGFYGWAYNPWPAPIAYSWGFGVGTPWFGFYGGYFAPYPVYPSASLWLTDYIISQNLAAAYADQQAAAAAQAQAAANAGAALPAPPAPLTPDVKQQIAAEVQRQIALENQESQMAAQGNAPDPASSGVVRMLTDGSQHVFVAGANVDVVNVAGTECVVGAGDALQLPAGPPPAADATTANLVMLSSKGGAECRKGDTVTVAYTDLQDMQNSMRETISAGMENLQKNQNRGGLPALPPSANVPPVKTEMASMAPPPDADAANQINQQAQGADQAEQEALNQVPTAPQDAGQSNQGAPAGPPKTIALGQSIDDVTSALGQPKSVVNLGAKKIYVYPDLKVTFNDGKVSDVQ